MATKKFRIGVLYCILVITIIMFTVSGEGTVLFQASIDTSLISEQGDLFDYNDVGQNGSYQVILNSSSTSQGDVEVQFQDSGSIFFPQMSDYIDERGEQDNTMRHLVFDIILKPGESAIIGAIVPTCDADTIQQSALTFTSINETSFGTINVKIILFEKGEECSGGDLRGPRLLNFDQYFFIGIIILLGISKYRWMKCKMQY